MADWLAVPRESDVTVRSVTSLTWANAKQYRWTEAVRCSPSLGASSPQERLPTYSTGPIDPGGPSARLPFPGHGSSRPAKYSLDFSQSVLYRAASQRL